MNALRIRSAVICLVALAGVCGLATAASAAKPARDDLPLNDIPKELKAPPVDRDYTRRIEMIPMRDRVKLQTFMLVPKGAKDAPILLTRTPYDASQRSKRSASASLSSTLQLSDEEFVKAGYIRVYQDARGQYGSEGDYVMERPARGPLNPTKTDHATDAWDTIDWLIEHLPESNGAGASRMTSSANMVSINYRGSSARWRILPTMCSGRDRRSTGCWLRGLRPYQRSGNKAFGIRTHLRREPCVARAEGSGAPRQQLAGDGTVASQPDQRHGLRGRTAWPVACERGCPQGMKPLYVGENAGLSFEQPSGAANLADSYISDPANPVPYLPRPIVDPFSNMAGGSRSAWGDMLVTDQRFVDGRPDVLTYQTPVLTSPVHVQGAPVVDLRAMTSGSDGDFVVKLIDVYPSDYPSNAKLA